MATLNISLPNQLREFIDIRVSSGEYQSASDYLRDLIRHDKEEIEQLLVEGIDSGKPKPVDMEAIKKRAKTILNSKEGK